MSTRQAPLTINMSTIRVAGVGGLGMVATIVVVAMAIPVARVLLLAGIACGALLAWWMIRSRRMRPVNGQSGSGPVGLVLSSHGEEVRGELAAGRVRAPRDPDGPGTATSWPVSEVTRALAPC
jgi:hypothetical protein